MSYAIEVGLRVIRALSPGMDLLLGEIEGVGDASAGTVELGLYPDQDKDTLLKIVTFAGKGTGAGGAALLMLQTLGHQSTDTLLDVTYQTTLNGAGYLTQDFISTVRRAGLLHIPRGTTRGWVFRDYTNANGSAYRFQLWALRLRFQRLTGAELKEALAYFMSV